MSLWLSQEHEKSGRAGTEVPKQELGNLLFMNLGLSQHNARAGGAGVPARPLNRRDALRFPALHRLRNFS